VSGYSPLDRPAQFLQGVGPRRAEVLARLGILTARDLLYHLPRRYEDATTVQPIDDLRPGMEATVMGRVVSKGVLPTRKGLRIFQAVVRDRSGMIECAWPGRPFLDRSIREGDLLLLWGSVRFFHGRQLHPREHEVLARKGESAEGGAGSVFPVYPATEGLSQRQVRALVEKNLGGLLREVAPEEVFEPALRERLGLPDLEEALRALHRPESLPAAEGGRRRLAYEELFFLQLLHALTRQRIRAASGGIAFRERGELTRGLFATLPFSLTAAQRRVLREIGEDMAAPRRMMRLLQGDVGAGKTVVALLAMLRAIENGWQAALMAPTEILAEQHARTLRQLIGDLPVPVTLLTGRLQAAERREALEELASGRNGIVVGTHALIQEGVEIPRLGLAVVDEQHRFGVRQRLALAEQGGAADTLVMSATPIPRSLALTLYGDLDISLLDERPPGRQPVRTAVRPAEARDAVLGFVRAQVEEGRQAYLVYPLVEESETMDLAAATTAFEELAGGPLSAVRLGLLHGQLPSEEKEEVMRRFAAGEVDVLVATTVVEVGVDVANATVMVIEHPERFGLSQLHQLRGRVGRGAEESYCILLGGGGDAEARLRSFAGTDDGFEIARLDMAIRGYGDLFGSRQSGTPELRHADPERDLDLLEAARAEARGVVDGDPTLERHTAYRDRLRSRYGDRLALYEVG
jgi:ATP-dependent DNA helicase RecG